MDDHQMALQAGFLVRPNENRFEVLCADTGEVLSPGHKTRKAAWEWAYEQVKQGFCALTLANKGHR